MAKSAVAASRAVNSVRVGTGSGPRIVESRASRASPCQLITATSAISSMEAPQNRKRSSSEVTAVHPGACSGRKRYCVETITHVNVPRLISAAHETAST